jgi:hypothetical protein
MDHVRDRGLYVGDGENPDFIIEHQAQHSTNYGFQSPALIREIACNEKLP